MEEGGGSIRRKRPLLPIPTTWTVDFININKYKYARLRPPIIFAGGNRGEKEAKKTISRSHP